MDQCECRDECRLDADDSRVAPRRGVVRCAVRRPRPRDSDRPGRPTPCGCRNSRLAYRTLALEPAYLVQLYSYVTRPRREVACRLPSLAHRELSLGLWRGLRQP